MSGIIKGKTPAQRAWVRGPANGKHFQDSSGDQEVMSNCDWLLPLYPSTHARQSGFDFPKSGVQPRGSNQIFPGHHKPR